MKRIKALSLFANVGISEAYFKSIGIDVLVANEIDEKRCKFYSEVYPDVKMVCGDITKDTTKNEIINLSKDKKIDLIIATPPCQGMSTAGKMDNDDLRNSLICHAVEIVKTLKPKYVFFENVPEQLKTKINIKGQKILIPDYLHNEFDKDYIFNDKYIVNAADYGVPQLRERAIILLVRNDIGQKWSFPKPLNKRKTLREAIGELPEVDPFLKEGLDETLKLFPDFNKKREVALKYSKFHYPPVHAKKHVVAMMHTASGCTAFDNPVYFPKKNNGDRVNGHYNTYRRLNWDKPSRTMTQNSGVISSLCCVHPGREYINNGEILYSDPRCLTLLELFIVTSLPIDWNVPKWADEKMIRKVIGEGIPPMLVKNIMLKLLSYL